MTKINENYRLLEKNYLFSETAARAAAFEAKHPEIRVLRLGIGDVTRPLPPAVVSALRDAAAEMSRADTFRGYGPEQGYPFLREAVCGYYAAGGVRVRPEEVYISDGAKSDLGNILDIFSRENNVLIPDPVYPVYADTNIMDGRPVCFLPATPENGFLPMPSDIPKDFAPDLIYLCSPNNPTGAAYTRKQLAAWVRYAECADAVILFDAAYEAFISDPEIPHSIYEVPGARTCVIEFCSLSKTAGFTGTRLGWTVVPAQLQREGVPLGDLWLRRQTTKYNGVSYIIQRGAAAVFSEDGLRQIHANLAYYKANAAVIMAALDELGIPYTGGAHSPYIWMECPDKMDSWAFFDLLLKKAGVVGTPGAGFGQNGRDRFRLTAFSTRETTEEAMDRLRKLLG